MPFYPEDGWAMPERQAEDQTSAEAKEAQRKVRYPEPTFKTKPRWNNAETKEWNPREVSGKWERGNNTNWNYPKEEWKETETDRTSRNRKEHLIEAEKIRVEGIKKHEERE